MPDMVESDRGDLGRRNPRCRPIVHGKSQGRGERWTDHATIHGFGFACVRRQRIW